MTTVITSAQLARHSKRIDNFKKGVEEKPNRYTDSDFVDTTLTACGRCINFMSGTCASRLNSPDYPTASVSPEDRGCSEFNVPSTRFNTDYDEVYGHDVVPVFDGLPSQVFLERDMSKSHDNRRVLELKVLSVDALHRLGYKNEQYPVLCVSVSHLGETAIFFLPNTVHRTLKHGEHVARVACNRYPIDAMFARVAEKGSIKLSNWQRVQYEL